MELYYCTHLDLNSGEIIQPGNWGKILLSTGINHPSWYRENILEAVRLEHFPGKPSRLASTFCCDSLDTIRCFRSSHNPTGHIYEVEHTDLRLPYHKGDFNAVEPLPRRTENMFQIASLYWQYDLKTSVEEWPGIECSEIVSQSPIKIINKIV
ncbi:MAG TPA: hypothetical protein VHA52_02145 [Candidatus Babeliaceae bacterium]|nr:hypothetical protein [Candidatus Babeliaceae bacterium]